MKAISVVVLMVMSIPAHTQDRSSPVSNAALMWQAFTCAHQAKAAVDLATAQQFRAHALRAAEVFYEAVDAGQIPERYLRDGIPIGLTRHVRGGTWRERALRAEAAVQASLERDASRTPPNTTSAERELHRALPFTGQTMDSNELHSR